MRRTAPLALAAGLAATLAFAPIAACSSDGSDRSDGSEPDRRSESAAGDDEATTTTTEPRLDIDPRRYFDEYAVGGDELAVSSGAAPTAAPAPQARASAESGVAADSSGGGSDGVAPIAPGEPSPVPLPGRPPEPPEPGISDDNTFVDPGSTPFTAAAGDPTTTFGLDVDTGSYSIGRTFLDQGSVPPPESVRTEEWVNAFGYDDPAPEGDDDIGVTIAGAPAPFADDGTQLVRVGVTARPVAADARPPAHVTLVVDTSGSMDIRERLGLVRSTMALLALHLRDDDTVAVVTYGDSSNVLLEPTPAAQAQTIVDAIEGLVPGGSTNMESGLRAGYDQARATFDPEAINTVVLASDGLANAGVSDTDALVDQVRAQGEEGIRLVTVGFGMGGYDDELMEQLADRGDGFYSYVDTYEEAERLFTSELTSTLTVVAADAKAQVTFDPAAVAEYRLVGYENRALADEDLRDDAVDAGELGAGHSVTALFEVRPVAAEDAEAEADAPAELGTVTLRHQPVAAGGVPGAAVELAVPIRTDDLADSFDAADADLRLAGTVAAFAELLGQRPATAERGVTLDRLAAAASALADDDDLATTDETGRPDAAELAQLIDLARDGIAPPVTEPGPGRPVPVPTPR